MSLSTKTPKLIRIRILAQFVKPLTDIRSLTTGTTPVSLLQVYVSPLSSPPVFKRDIGWRTGYFQITGHIEVVYII